MTAPLRPDPPLYAAVAMDYLASGVGFPLPLPPQAKQYPPKGATGRLGIDPTPGKVKAWCRNRQPRTNVALRLVTGVVGIDVDASGGKQGECTLGRLEQLLGSLPATVVSTSRTDGVSGIGLFQVPPDRLWTPSVRVRQQDGLGTGHIDVSQRSHRYAKTDERAATFKADRLTQHICRVVDSAPLLTPAQRDRLAVLLQSPRTSW